MTCPFCKATIKYKSAKYNDFGGYGKAMGVSDKQWWAIYCPSCGVSQPKKKYFTKEDASMAWEQCEK